MDDWTMFANTVFYSPKTKLMMEWGGMDMDDDYVFSMERKMNKALKAMHELEGGAIANPDEDRMVGHYWLRAPELAPTQELRDEIQNCLARIKSFVAESTAASSKTPWWAASAEAPWGRCSYPRPWARRGTR